MERSHLSTAHSRTGVQAKSSVSLQARSLLVPMAREYGASFVVTSGPLWSPF
jgi:hypothetical protein